MYFVYFKVFSSIVVLTLIKRGPREMAISRRSLPLHHFTRHKSIILSNTKSQLARNSPFSQLFLASRHRCRPLFSKTFKYLRQQPNRDKGKSKAILSTAMNWIVTLNPNLVQQMKQTANTIWPNCILLVWAVCSEAAYKLHIP